MISEKDHLSLEREGRRGVLTEVRLEVVLQRSKISVLIIPF